MLGILKKTSFLLAVTNFCWTAVQSLIKTYNFGQNAVNEKQFKNKNEQYCAVRLFNFKVAETFCQFSVRECWYFLPCSLHEIAPKVYLHVMSLQLMNNLN